MKIVLLTLFALTLQADTTKVTFPNGQVLVVKSDSKLDASSKTPGCVIEKLKDGSEVVTMDACYDLTASK